jgi:hypothetical protein
MNETPEREEGQLDLEMATVLAALQHKLVADPWASAATTIVKPSWTC